jgi:hypothetical protein
LCGKGDGTVQVRFYGKIASLTNVIQGAVVDGFPDILDGALRVRGSDDLVQPKRIQNKGTKTSNSDQGLGYDANWQEKGSTVTKASQS